MHCHLNVKFVNDVRGSPGYRVAGASDHWSASLDGQSAYPRTVWDMQKACSHLWGEQIRMNIADLLLLLREIDGICVKQRKKRIYKKYIGKLLL